MLEEKNATEIEKIKESQESQDNKEPYIVGIGASAGGLEALQKSTRKAPASHPSLTKFWFGLQSPPAIIPEGGTNLWSRKSF